ncbi:MAG: NYN domain-containing protein [Stutzerimonas stutzeri]|nr:MAG: NYN domain-containing protein [Stutzerimonas stutzeri]
MKPIGHAALVIDGPNFYHACKGLGFSVDWKRLLQHFSNGTPNTRAYYYTAVLDGADDPLRPTLDWMDYHGFKVVTKPVKEFKSTDEIRRKGNMDVEIAVDCVEMADRIERLVLFSGDGDFRRVVEAVQRKGVHVTVVSTSGMIADELRREADSYIDVANITLQIKRIQDAPATRELSIAS